MHNLAIQYTIVAALLIGALIWIVVKLRKVGKRKGGACCGCSMSHMCSKSEHPHLKRGETKHTAGDNHHDDDDRDRHRCPGKKDCCR